MSLPELIRVLERAQNPESITPNLLQELDHDTSRHAGYQGLQNPESIPLTTSSC